MEHGVVIYTVKDNFVLGDSIQSKVLAFAFGLSAEIIYHRKRYRFRSTNLDNAQHWLSMMSEKFSD